jgi:acetyl-CoA carboxylase biotin carboxyl carrier protein
MGWARAIRMKIDDQLIKQLSFLIRERGIDLLELTTPEASLSLQRDTGADSSSRASVLLPSEVGSRAPATHASAKAASHYELTAPSPGIYLDRHPLSAQPLVSPGALIEASQLVGFLQISSLLLPLRSAQAGRVVSLPQEPGVTLGYGSVVMCLLTAERS